MHLINVLTICIKAMSKSVWKNCSNASIVHKAKSMKSFVLNFKFNLSLTYSIIWLFFNAKKCLMNKLKLCLYAYAFSAFLPRIFVAKQWFLNQGRLNAYKKCHYHYICTLFISKSILHFHKNAVKMKLSRKRVIRILFYDTHGFD